MRCGWLLLAVGALGCGSRTLWYGRTPDRTQSVEVLESGSFQYVVVGGEEQRRYRAVAVESLALSPDGRHVAYAAQSQGRWGVVVDEREGRWHEAVGDLLLSTDGSWVAYAAKDSGAWSVWVDGTRGPSFDAILEDTLGVTTDGRRAVYIAQRGGDGFRAVVHPRGGEASAGPAFVGIRQLVSGPDGSVAYVARDDAGSRVVLDGRPQKVFEGIGELVLGREHLAYAGRRADGWVAVVDGLEGPVYRRVDDLRISETGVVAYVATTEGEQLVVSDGTIVARHARIARDSLRQAPSGRLAWVAREKGGERMMLDGEPGPLLDAVAPAVFAPVGARWGYIARKGATTSVVIDGRPEAKFEWVADLVFSPDGRRYAYAAHSSEKDYLVHDRGSRAVPRIIVGTIAFDPSGEHVGCVIADPRSRELHFAIDGRRHERLDVGELVAHAAADVDRFTEDRDLMRRWVAAELAQAARSEAP